MLKLSLQLIAVIVMAVSANAQLNLNYLGDLSYPQNRGDVSDIWGYVDEFGNEYAIVGNQTGTSIVDVSDPANPTEIFYRSEERRVGKECISRWWQEQKKKNRWKKEQCIDTI